MTLAVEAAELGRWYGDVVGLSDVTLASEGGVVGLLQPAFHHFEARMLGGGGPLGQQQPGVAQQLPYQGAPQL